MATLPFMAAKTAKEQGHDVVLWLRWRARSLPPASSPG
jgi:predicted peroxiredoxin